MIGKCIMGRYEILERIGGGGMGVVWKANDKVLDRYVALKVLRPEMSEDEDFVRRFRREAKAAASLSHPNIVSIYDVGEDQGLYFIVMELVEGETLRDKLTRQGKLEVEETLNIAGQICLGLSHAHTNQIIHRDIKPQNILITTLGHVKVADFGIARALGGVSNTSTNVVVGSASYLSPEQARNGVVSARSDLYSLGVVLYEMITGKPPFTGDSPVSVALQHVEAKVPAVRDKNPEIPVEIESLIAKALAKSPDMRFQSADEMLKSIRQLRLSLFQRTETEFAAKGDEQLARRKKPKARVSTAVKIFAVFLIVGLAAAAYGIYAFNKWMAVPLVEVPDVVGKPQIEAQTLIREKGLIPQLSAEKYDSSYPANTVISQSPLGGEMVKKGREIYYVLSRGESFAEVPDVRSKTVREAQLELENRQLQLGNVDNVFHPTLPKDHVIGQNPREGTSVSLGTRVDLIVSLGQEPETAVVPRLIGLPSLDKARALLEENLLELGEVSQISGQLPYGTIISQNPEEGTEVPIRTRVAVAISLGSQEPVHSHEVKIKVPNKANPVNVRVVVMDLDGEVVRHDRNENPGDNVTVSFQYKGNVAIMKVYFDGELAREEIIKP
jgi:beta-lactam-binding protein with PASTA domain/tRNA A-37 threonylcarbamoyl transferase component Bud32